MGLVANPPPSIDEMVAKWLGMPTETLKMHQDVCEQVAREMGHRGPHGTPTDGWEEWVNAMSQWARSTAPEVTQPPICQAADESEEARKAAEAQKPRKRVRSADETPTPTRLKKKFKVEVQHSYGTRRSGGSADESPKDASAAASSLRKSKSRR